MRKNLCVGILREEKDHERRAPITPKDVRWLVKKGIKVEVESSGRRVFKDSEYRRNGARIVNRFSKASLLVGIKEPNIDRLYNSSIYMLFSHTIKGQFNNMPLLKAALSKKTTLIDYEKISDPHGRRLVYFGRFAGICGAIDSLHFLGRKLQWKGIKNPFVLIKPAHKYNSLSAAKQDIAKVDEEIRRKGLDVSLSPFVIGITGHGNVSRGIQEILSLLNPIEVHPRDMLGFIKHEKGARKKLYKIVFLREEKLRSKDGRGFYFEEYLNTPERFESNLDRYLQYLNVLLHASYWDHKYPRMVTKDMIRRLSKRRLFKLEFIGDISCDVSGSVEITYKTTDQNNPVYTYDPKRSTYADGYERPGVTVLSIDNLPSELPKDASVEFGSLIRDYVYQVAAHGIKDVTKHTAIPAEVRRAVVTEKGKLTKDYRYLRDYIK
ncbi:MAG: hypothetical protein ISS26_08125 [Candidatus Omnitrophica bacterium]|nr:hypothetical protein [Candidatus Omnitrophota bacterium]